MSRPFDEFAAEKARTAAQADIGCLATDEDQSAYWPVLEIGNDWTRRHYGGPFALLPEPASLPAVSLVFVQSREGNTVSDDPADLGGGETDLHLIYEGLSRVAADAVLAGARTASGRVFFSVWHPELVALRHALGLARHPAQIVVSGQGDLDLDDGLLFNVPEVPVYILAGSARRDHFCRAVAARPWITVVPIESGLPAAFRELRARGVRRVSVVGGRTTATAIMDAGLARDIYLTTTSKSAGRPDTPLYAGSRPPAFDRIVAKHSIGLSGEAAIRFEHLRIR